MSIETVDFEALRMLFGILERVFDAVNMITKPIEFFE